eukprot:2507589-Rhodomonas_salina.2
MSAKRVLTTVKPTRYARIAEVASHAHAMQGMSLMMKARRAPSRVYLATTPRCPALTKRARFQAMAAVTRRRPTATRAEHADGTSNSAGCASCNAYGEPMACYQKDAYYSQCLVVGACLPSDWGAGSFSCAETFNTDGIVVFRQLGAVDSQKRTLKAATVLPDTDGQVMIRHPLRIGTTEQSEPPIPNMALGSLVLVVAVLGVAVVAARQQKREKASPRFQVSEESNGEASEA